MRRPSPTIARIEREPKNPIAYSGRGYSHARLGFHTKAIADYSRAIVLNPWDASSYFNRALAYTEIGRHGQAATAKRSSWMWNTPLPTSIGADPMQF